MAGPVEPQLRGARRRLVDAIRSGGIADPRVLAAFETVPRHLFVPAGVRHRAYEDSPLPIGSGQTISQPSVHARYLELLALKGDERVLEIGTGSGYQTALLAQLAAQVFTVERIASLMESARVTLAASGIKNASYLMGDGTLGWRDYAPYDAILVSAGAPSVPSPLLEQLAEGGRLLIPLGDREIQSLRLITRVGDRFQEQDIYSVRFVPLLGTHGWPAS